MWSMVGSTDENVNGMWVSPSNQYQVPEARRVKPGKGKTWGDEQYISGDLVGGLDESSKISGRGHA